MDLESLESFLEVEKHKNFTKAAESMFCTQAAVSMRIKRLETALECGLFKRCGRRVELTREGEIFLPYARQMVNTWKSASEHLLQTRLMEESEIRITSSSTPGTYIIPSLIYLFRQSYPYITVINHIQYTRSAISDVIGGNFSLGIISQPASVGTDVLCCEPLMEDPLVLVVHPQHPWAEKSHGRNLADIQSQYVPGELSGKGGPPFLRTFQALCGRQHRGHQTRDTQPPGNFHHV